LKNKLKVLVVGAAGRQGGAVALEMLKRGHVVHAFTRNPDKKAIQSLSNQGAKIVQGDLLNKNSIEQAAEDVDFIFGMTTPFESGVEAEARQGIHLVEVAKAKGKKLVYSSVAAANQNTGIPHYESKWKVEQHIKKVLPEATVIAPVHFMENLTTMQLQPLREGKYASALRPETKLEQLSLEDLGAFVCMLFENGERLAGQRFELASDKLSGEEAAAIVARLTGKPIHYVQIPLEAIRQKDAGLAMMLEWLDKHGYKVDIPALKSKFPEIRWHTFESWIKEQNWPVLTGIAPIS